MKHYVEYVLVNWSESRLFKEEKRYSLNEFEYIANVVAHSNAPKSGYDKTKVTVHFSDGAEITVRLDLSQSCDHGLRHYIRNGADWHSEYAVIHPIFTDFYKKYTMEDIA